MKIVKNVFKTGLVVLFVAALLTIFAVLFALAPDETWEKVKRETWEQSPYGG